MLLDIFILKHLLNDLTEAAFFIFELDAAANAMPIQDNEAVHLARVKFAVDDVQLIPQVVGCPTFQQNGVDICEAITPSDEDITNADGTWCFNENYFHDWLCNTWHQCKCWCSWPAFLTLVDL